MNTGDAEFVEHCKLKVILCADIVGYSGSKKPNVNKALAILAKYNKILQESIGRFEGTVIKTTGGSCLAAFDSALKATECAINVQQRFRRHKIRDPRYRKMKVRIGIHLGEVVSNADEVFGDAVDVATRIQSTAKPGGISISRAVYDVVIDMINARILSQETLKRENIKEAIEVYEIGPISPGKRPSKARTMSSVVKTAIGKTKVRVAAVLVIALLAACAFILFLLPSAAPPLSIALLPFENLGEISDEYLVSGMTEELISRLSSVPNLRVIGKKTVFHYRSKDLDEYRVANELSVTYLFFGSVKVLGDAVTVVVHLTEPRREKTIWTEKFEMRKQNFIQLQNEIPQNIAARLGFADSLARVNLSGAVFELYLKGLSEARKQTRQSNLLAISLFRRAIEKDSIFPRLFSELASSELANIEWSWDDDEKWLHSANHHASKALELDPSSGDALGILGRIAERWGHRTEAIKMLRESLRLDPNNAPSLTKLGEIYAFELNDPMNALDCFIRARQLDPNDFTTVCNLAIGFGVIKDYQSAIAGFRDALKLEPNSSWVWTQLGIGLERTAQYDSSIASYSRALELDPSNADARESLGSLLLVLSNFSKAETILVDGLATNPASYQLRYLIGIAQQLLGKSSEAKNSWTLGLKMAEHQLNQNSNAPKPLLWAGIFSARLGADSQAVSFGIRATSLDSLDSAVLIEMARIYAILGWKQPMLNWYSRARSRASDLDEAYLRTSVDFQKYSSDSDLLAIAIK